MSCLMDERCWRFGARPASTTTGSSSSTHAARPSTARWATDWKQTTSCRDPRPCIRPSNVLPTDQILRYCLGWRNERSLAFWEWEYNLSRRSTRRRSHMRRYSMLAFVLIICGGLTLTLAGQRNPQRPAPGPQTRPGQPQANPEQNKQVARRVFDDLFTAGRYGEIDQIYDRNCTVHFGNRS